jgi:hypothetical protein
MNFRIYRTGDLHNLYISVDPSSLKGFSGNLRSSSFAGFIWSIFIELPVESIRLWVENQQTCNIVTQVSPEVISCFSYDAFRVWLATRNVYKMVACKNREHNLIWILRPFFCGITKAFMCFNHWRRKANWKSVEWVIKLELVLVEGTLRYPQVQKTVYLGKFWIQEKLFDFVQEVTVFRRDLCTQKVVLTYTTTEALYKGKSSKEGDFWPDYFCTVCWIANGCLIIFRFKQE